MQADELFKAGQLQPAIEAQRQEVKSHPGDQGRRLFLFELLAFSGDLERARKQIDFLEHDDLEQEAATTKYRKLLDAEEARRRLFVAGVPPTFLGAVPEHARLRLEAVDRLREGHRKEAAETLARAAEATPDVRGALNEQPFEQLCDCDDLFGGILEIMSQGQYLWVPLETIEALVLSRPRFPRDLLWVPGHLDIHDGPAGEVFLPVLYPSSHEHPDDQVKLGRLTDWTSDAPVLGRGQRTCLVDGEPLGVLQWRELLVEKAAADAPGTP